MGKERGLIRLSSKQFNSARAIIKIQCCNYDNVTGSCLALEKLEPVPCPQLLTQSMVCRHFRDVLLEDKRNREFKAEVMGESHRKVCDLCGQHFRALSNRAKYCAKCAKIKRLEQERTRQQRNRA